jgi:hypothetical protein
MKSTSDKVENLKKKLVKIQQLKQKELERDKLLAAQFTDDKKETDEKK